MWKQLLWKQWKEQSWRIAFATVILTAFTAIGLWTRATPDQYVIVIAAVLGATLIPIFITMGLIAPQRADRSFDSLIALPVQGRELFCMILLTGLIGAWAPLLATLSAALAIAGDREISTPLLLFYFGGVMLYSGLVVFWTLCFSIRQQYESRVGLIGLIILIGWIALAMGLMGITRGGGHWAFAFHPLSIGNLIPRQGTGAQFGYPAEGYPLMTAMNQLVFAAGLGFWALRQFHRPTKVHP